MTSRWFALAVIFISALDYSPRGQTENSRAFATLLNLRKDAELSPRYHQRFVNGLFEASPEEEQFAAQLINAKAQAMNAPGTAGPSNTDYLVAQRLNRIWTWLQHERLKDDRRKLEGRFGARLLV